LLKAIEDDCYGWGGSRIVVQGYNTNTMTRPEPMSKKQDPSSMTNTFSKAKNIFFYSAEVLYSAGDREEKIFALLRTIWSQIEDHVKHIEDMLSLFCVPVCAW
jgi:hypothetical protein